MDIRAASKYSFTNRQQLEMSKKAGCYYCLSIFNPSEIEEWTGIDDSALCPKCGIDSVLGDTSPYSIDKKTLKELKDYWF